MGVHWMLNLPWHIGCAQYIVVWDMCRCDMVWVHMCVFGCVGVCTCVNAKHHICKFFKHLPKEAHQALANSDMNPLTP